MSDELGINVQGGDPYAPGYTAQRSPDGIALGAGAYSAEPVGFGVANDEGGLSINAYPTAPEVYTLHYFLTPGEATLDFPGAGTLAEALCVAGGGTGGGGKYGGGGAGGEVKTLDAVELGGTVPVFVGAGGTGGVGIQDPGGPSSFGETLLYCHGGGSGAVVEATIGEALYSYPATAEWTGGGMWSDGVDLLTPPPHGPSFWGGCGAKGTMYGYLGASGGGGAGAGQCGWDAASNWGGGGGDGVVCNIINRYVKRWWGAGGGGSVQPHSYIPGLFTYGWGGRGGGGGAHSFRDDSSHDTPDEHSGDPFNYATLPENRDYRGAGYPNSGGGGGAGGNYGENSPQTVGKGLCANGGHGVVIVRYPGPPRATGGTIEVRRVSDGGVV